MSQILQSEVKIVLFVLSQICKNEMVNDRAVCAVPDLLDRYG